MDLSSGSSSSKIVGEKDRGEEEDLDAASGGDSSRLKMRALKSVMQSEAAQSPKLVCSDVVDIPVLTTSEVTSPMKEVPVSVLREGFFPLITRCSSDLLGGRDGRYSCNSGEISQSLKMNNDMTKEHCSGSKTNTVQLGGCQMLEETAAPVHVFDLNAVDIASAAEHNQFHPYKMLEQVTSAESECGSTTSPFVESGPMKRWNDLKQNSFISNSYGGIPIPKAPQRKYQSKKRKEAELRKNTEFAKKEQLSRFSRTAAPTGLLSGLNPGIINHVRNSKQVRSIIESIVKSAKLDELCNQSDMEGKEANNTNSDPQWRHHSDAYNPSLSHITSKSDCIDETSGGQTSEEKISHDGYKSSCFTSKCDDDTLSLKLSSSGVNNIVDNESCRTNDEFSASPETINALSLRGASIASQWLELLHQDLRGRYAALKRSRKRVRNVIQTELPHLYNAFNCEKSQHTSQSSGINGSIDAHAARWKSIFSQMEKTLNEEATHLESCLLQVREMQSHCDMGLKHANATNASVSGSSSLSSQKDARAVEREYAIMAAAASIHSTCEFAMSTENVSCF